MNGNVFRGRKRRNAVRCLIMAATLGMTLGAVIIKPLAASSIGLRESTVISDSTIKLGDIFYGLERDEDKVLGPAPEPGQEIVLSASTLMRVAVALDLPWRPQNTGQTMTLKRAATVIERAAIENALRQEMEAKGIPGKFSILLPANFTRIVLPQEEAATLDIVDMTVHAKDKRFEAAIVAPSAANPIYRRQISGNFERLVQVPVLRQSLGKGSIINDRDLDFIDVRERDLQPDMVLSADTIKGMTPRRLVTAGTPIKLVDLETPQMVGRGELVTMIFRSGNLLLTAKGKALENGAEGDMIRVVNTDSNKTVQGQITASQEVTVTAF